MWAPRYQCFSHQMNNRQPWQLKKSKSWGQFWSYQLNSNANSAHFALVDDYSFDMKNIDIWAPTFFKHNNSLIATVEAKQTFNEGNKYCRQITDVQLTLNFDLYKEFAIVSFMK